MIRLYEILLPAILLLLLAFLTPVRAAAPPPALGSSEKPLELSWVDAETGNVIFTLADIVRFDWDRQIFELSPEAATKVLALPIVQRRDFAVKDREGVIYRGRFYRSSATDGEGYDGTTILIDQGPLKKLPASPFYIISGGYPTGGGAHDRDRFSERLRTLLVNANVIKPIVDAEMPIIRWWSGHIWVGGEQALKASTVLFPETFRVGKDAYIHLLLYKGQRTDFLFDKLVVYATCIANEGKFAARQEILSLTPPLLDNGIYVCKFRPWETLIIPSTQDTAYSPAIVSGTPPRYPKDAANDDREGKVVVLVTVESDGKVSGKEITGSSGHADIDKSVVRAIEKYTFSPISQGGISKKGTVKFLFTFAKGKVEQQVLPPDPVKIAADAGPMNISFEVVALKLENGNLVKIDSWMLPTRKMNLLPELPPPAPPVVAPASIPATPVN